MSFMTNSAAVHYSMTGYTPMNYSFDDLPKSAQILSLKKPPAHVAVQATSHVENMERISQHLCSDSASPEFQSTLRWIIYKIVATNKGITYVQLKKILRGEYGIDKRLLDTAISSLTSPTLLNGLKKWRNRRMQEVGSEIGIHLFLHNEESDNFRQWRELTVKKYPELEFFTPPNINRSPIRRDNG